jgi:transcription initiation factor TFIID subunit 9B
MEVEQGEKVWAEVSPTSIKLNFHSSSVNISISTKDPITTRMETQTPAAPGPNGQSDDEPSIKRPRDAHLIHTLLATQGVTSYQERVPLMLIDFAYRYTRSILSDGATLSAEGYGGPSSGGTEEQRRGRGASSADDVTAAAMRLATSARQIGQLPAHMSKADLVDLAGETNRVGLPIVRREFGVRLPGDKFLLTGGAFRLRDEWEDEYGEDEEGEEAGGELEDEVMKDEDEDEDDDGGLLDDEDMDEDDYEAAMGTDTKMED